MYQRMNGRSAYRDNDVVAQRLDDLWALAIVPANARCWLNHNHQHQQQCHTTHCR